MIKGLFGRDWAAALAGADVASELVESMPWYWTPVTSSGTSSRVTSTSVAVSPGCTPAGSEVRANTLVSPPAAATLAVAAVPSALRNWSR